MLTVNNLSKKFGKKTVLKNISVEFDNGIYGLLGPNGSGKTTFIRAVTGLYSTPKNTVLYKGTDIGESREYFKQIGYLPQSFGLYKELNVSEVMELFANLKGIGKEETKQAIDDALKMVNLTNEANKKCAALSGGMVRRVGVAQAFLGNPKIVILDEPTVGLDPEERLRLKNAISRLSKDRIVIISTHIVEDVEALCNKIVIMNSGRVLVNDDVNEVVKIAQDKVYTLPETELENIKTNYHLEKQFFCDGVNYSRILSKEKLDYDRPKPTIEDAYIYTINDDENVF